MITLTVIVLVAVIVIGVAAIFLYLSKRSQRVRSRFGPEYSRAIQDTGSKYRAETKLENLEKRVDKFSIHPLKPAVATRFRESWREVQAEFVDNPETALSDADRLVEEVMNARGCPVTDFEHRAAEISVNHALVVEHYRAGHHIAISHAKGEATTEDMRQAMIHYRTLFDDLLGAPEIARARSAGSL